MTTLTRILILTFICCILLLTLTPLSTHAKPKVASTSSSAAVVSADAGAPGEQAAAEKAVAKETAAAEAAEAEAANLGPGLELESLASPVAVEPPSAAVIEPAAATTPTENPVVVAPQTQSEAIATVVESLPKADDKEGVEATFVPVLTAPKGGVRLVKDILTGKLKPIPREAPAKFGEKFRNKGSKNGEKGGPAGLVAKMSAVVAAAMAGASGPGAAMKNALSLKNLPTGMKGKNGRPVPPGFGPNKAHQRHAGKIDIHAAGGNSGSKEFHSKDAKPMHLSLGTEMGKANVILDGVVNPSWNVTEQTPGATSIPPEKDFIDFFLWRTLGSEDGVAAAGTKRKPRIITGQKPFIFINNSEIVEVKINSWGNKHMIPIPLSNGTMNIEDEMEGEEGDEKEEISTKFKNPAAKAAAERRAKSLALKKSTSSSNLPKKNELLFSLQFECHSKGNTLITVVLRTFEMTRGQRSSTSIQWSFLKQCLKPNENIEEKNMEGNVALPGLVIGTRNNASDVVEHGEAKPSWTLGSEKNEHILHTYNSDIEGAKWWMRYDPPVTDKNLTVNKAVFIIDDPTILLVEDSGDLTEQSSVLKSGRTFTLALTFTCKKAGSTDVTIVFSFPENGLENSKISFSFRKECSGLMVGDGATMNGIDIWQNENEDSRKPEVVENGLVLPSWRPIQNLTNEPDMERTAGADRDTKYVSFFIKLRKGHHPVEYDTPVVESYSGSGEVILRPNITGSVMESSSLVSKYPKFLILAFNCIKEGDAVVTVKIPFRPSGSIQFNLRKSCEVITTEEIIEAKSVSEYSTGDTLIPLPGIHIGHFIDSDSVVSNGIPNTYYHWESNIEDLMLVGSRHQWVNFFLWKNSTNSQSQDIRFGRPELISTADIARPVISGLGAEGGLIADNEYSTISITFHCFTQGNTTITLIIPLTDDEWLNARNEPVSIKPIRPDPIKISFVKECPLATEEPIIGMGGIGISGLFIGFNSSSSELVYNGFPQPEYFGQRMKLKPDWDDVIIPSTSESTTIYIHYNSKSGENALVGKEVMFQSPVIVAHNPNARPVLAGSAATGGILVRDGPALPLDITFNCRYLGLAVATLIIPIVPHGQISVTIPKQCQGDQAPHGVKVSGLHVGTTAMGSEVVKDGQTTSTYMSYATKKYQEHKVFPEEETTVFYIRSTGEPIRALEPMIYVRKAILNVRVSHALLLNSTEIDDDVNGDEIEINSEVATINITYACVEDGHTDITISLNLLPKGQVQWTFEKHCGGEEVEFFSPLAPGDAGIVPGGDNEGLYDYSDRLRREDEEAVTPYRFGHGTSEWDSEPAELDDEYGYGGYRSGTILPGAPIPAEASITTSEPSYSWEESNYNPHNVFDHDDVTHRTISSSVSTFQIGTGRELESRTDVFYKSLPRPRFQMKNKAALDINQYAVVKPDQDSSTFYLSSTSLTGQKFNTPTLSLDKKYLSFLKPVLSGPGSVGSVISSMDAAPLRLDVTYNCLKGGVFAVPFRIGVGDSVAAFRVIKICPNFEIKEQFYWTAGKVMTVILLVAGIIAAIVGFFAFRKIFQARKSMAGANALYVPVQTEQEQT